MKVAGVIVTYNRKELLLKNIKQQVIQKRKVDKLYIIDNHSTDGTRETIKNVFPMDGWIDYIYMNENGGGAGGFFEGTKVAFEAGFDYIWLMDDDGRPLNPDTLSELLLVADKVRKKNSRLLLNSLVTVDGKELSFGYSMNKNLKEQFELVSNMKKPNNILKNHANPFNGTLLSKETVSIVGYPKKEFFLGRDETDYLRRCEDNNVFIGTVTTSLYHHPNGISKGVKFGKNAIPLIENHLKQYYWVRNMTYSYKKRHKARLTVNLILQFICILLFQNQKMTRIKIFMKALNDAIHNKMGMAEWK